MASQVVGRVRPTKEVEFDPAATYGPLDRVKIDDVIYECTGQTLAGESPSTTPDRWIVISPGFSKEEFDAVTLLAENALPKSGGEMTGPVSGLKIGGSLSANLYDASAVSAKWARDRCLYKAVNGLDVFIDSVNGSDTADLYAGRGSMEKPFLTLHAAANLIGAAYAGIGGVTFKLLNDIALPESGTLYMPLDFITRITSADPDNPVKVTVTKNFALGSGNFALGDLKIHGSDGAQNLIFCTGYSRYSRVLIDGSIEFSGTAAQAVIGVYWGGRVNILGGAQLTGSPSGKKYDVGQASQLFTSGVQIPGSLAGQVSTGSVFA